MASSISMSPSSSFSDFLTACIGSDSSATEFGTTDCESREVIGSICDEVTWEELPIRLSGWIDISYLACGLTMSVKGTYTSYGKTKGFVLDRTTRVEVFCEDGLCSIGLCKPLLLCFPLTFASCAKLAAIKHPTNRVIGDLPPGTSSIKFSPESRLNNDLRSSALQSTESAAISQQDRTE